MIRTILRHIARIVRLMLTAPGRMLAGLLGTGRQAPPPEAIEELVVNGSPTCGRTRCRPEPDEAPLRALGESSRLRGGDAGARRVRLLGMPDDVAVALCVMSSDQLARLAARVPQARVGRRAKGVVRVPSS